MSSVRPIRPGTAMFGVKVRVLLIVKPDTAAALGSGAALRGGHRLDIEILGDDGLSAASTTVAAADVVVVEIDPSDAIMFDEFETFVAELHGKRQVIAAVRDLDVAATRLVLRAGAADILALPFVAFDFARVIDATAAVPKAHRTATTRRGKVVAFLGAIGGCGTTALAVQAGVAWAADTRVCLIDFDLQFGNAALYLDLKPKLSVIDVLGAGDRLDEELLMTIAEAHASGLMVIASPSDMHPLEILNAAMVEKTVRLAASVYDVVLIDLPSAWTPWSLRAIELADITLLVTNLSVPGIHQARRQLEIITTNNPDGALQVVLNRVAHPMLGKIDLSETEALLGRTIDHPVANDYPTVSAAIDGGKALATVKSRTRVDRDIRAMVKSMATTLDIGRR